MNLSAAEISQVSQERPCSVALTRPTQTLECFGRDAEISAVTRLLKHPVGRAGVMLAGPGGVGKTRLVEECSKALEVDYRVIRFLTSATEGPPDHGPQAPAFVPLGVAFPAALCKLLTTSCKGRPVLITVDNAHLLGAASAALLLEVALSRRVMLLVTVDTDADLPDAIAALWKGDHLARIDVHPLGTGASRRMAAAMLDNKLALSSAAKLARLSAGNPLLLRELVRAFLEERRLTFTSGHWVLGQGLPTSAPLRHALGERIRRLDARARDALELVLLGEPLPLDVLEQLATPSTLVTLEAQGLISAGSDDALIQGAASRMPVVKSSSPLVRQAVLQDLPLLRRRHHLRTLAEAYRWADSPQDRLRAVTWRLDSGDAVAPADLADAARHAYRNMHLQTASHLSAAAWERNPCAENAVLRAAVLVSLAEFDDAFRVLDVAQREFPGHVGLKTVRVRARLLQGRLEEADELAMDLPGPQGLSSRAMAAYFGGRFDHALALCEAVADADGAQDLPEVAVFHMATLCHAGRPLDALGLHERATSGSGAEDGSIGRDEGSLREIHAAALHYAGRMSAARDVLGRSYEDALADEQTKLDARRGLALGFVLLEMGKPVQALPFFSLTSAHDIGWKLWHDKAAVYAMLAAAMLPGSAAAERAAAQLPPIEQNNLYAHSLIAHAWAAALRCDNESAARLLVRAAQASQGHGGHADTAFAVHEMGRLGFAAQTAPFWDTPVQGSFLQARLDYSRALATKDTALLRTVVQAFVVAGADLYAAEGYAELSRLYRRSGDERAATAAKVRAQELAARCEGALTPPLHALDEVEPLTSREREIALLAARGLSDKEIADRLTLSIRTVGNHLYRIYRKLGATNRQDLRVRLDIS